MSRTARMPDVRVSAKADYAVRAMIELVGSSEEAAVKGDRIAAEQEIPLHFLENILAELRRAGLVNSRRGAEGGYWLGRAEDEIAIADVIRAVEGPLATVRGDRPDELAYRGDAAPLQQVWVALRANVRQVLETVTLADVVADRLPAPVRNLAEHPEGAELRPLRGRRA
jgi:Rrf2 family protein